MKSMLNRLFSYNLMDINRFRNIRLWFSLLACLIRVLIHLNANFDIISRLTLFGIGLEIIVFGKYFLAAIISHYVLKALFKEGFTPKHNLANLIVDTIVYLIFCIIVIFLFLVLWFLFVLIIFSMGGVPQVD